MANKRKGSHRDRQSKNRCKVTNEDCIHQRIKRLFISGGQYTASEINRICGGNDARKAISRLRKEDLLNIRDLRLETGCKLYWYAPDSLKGGKND